MSVVHQAQVEVILGKMSQISPFLSFVSEVLLGSRLASTKVGVGHNTSLWSSKHLTNSPKKQCQCYFLAIYVKLADLESKSSIFANQECVI